MHSMHKESGLLTAGYSYEVFKEDRTWIIEELAILYIFGWTEVMKS